MTNAKAAEDKCNKMQEINAKSAKGEYKGVNVNAKSMKTIHVSM